MSEIATRNAYGKTLAELSTNSKIVVLDADLSCCTMTCYFAAKQPDRFFNCGIAEANMVGVAAGMATTGCIPFVNSFAMFMAGRCFEQIRNSVAYPHLNVKLIGTHAGLSVGEDGATHQCLEDIGLMRTIPGMTIMCPCDANETREAVLATVAHEGPVYLRLGRKAVPDVTGNIQGYTFVLGKGATLINGNDVTLIATGIMVHLALKASVALSKLGISARVVDMHTIKPLDKKIIKECAAETGAIVTAEEHNLQGGLGDAVASVLVTNKLVPMERVGVQDAFGRSGTPEELFTHYGLTSEAIVQAAQKAITRKGN